MSEPEIITPADVDAAREIVALLQQQISLKPHLTNDFNRIIADVREAFGLPEGDQ